MKHEAVVEVEWSIDADYGNSVYNLEKALQIARSRGVPDYAKVITKRAFGDRRIKRMVFKWKTGD